MPVGAIVHLLTRDRPRVHAWYLWHEYRPSLALFFLSFLLILSPIAGGEAGSALRPYTARYDTSVMGMDITLRRQLRQQESQWTLTNSGSVLFFSLSEEAQFRIDQGRILADSFLYRLKGPVNRRREVQFDPEQQRIRSLRKDEWTEHPWSPEVLDRLSTQEQLRLDLMTAPQAPETLTSVIIDGHRIKTRTFTLIEEVSITTPAGDFRTLRYDQVHDDPERQSTLWFAIDADYLLVRSEHVEDGSAITVALKSLRWDDPTTEAED
jgi:hypothetical protein